MTFTQPLWNPPITGGWYENPDGTFTTYHGSSGESTTCSAEDLGLPKPSTWVVRALVGARARRIALHAESASEARALMEKRYPEERIYITHTVYVQVESA